MQGMRQACWEFGSCPNHEGARPGSPGVWCPIPGWDLGRISTSLHSQAPSRQQPWLTNPSTDLLAQPLPSPAAVAKTATRGAVWGQWSQRSPYPICCGYWAHMCMCVYVSIALWVWNEINVYQCLLINVKSSQAYEYWSVGYNKVSEREQGD